MYRKLKTRLLKSFNQDVEEDDIRHALRECSQSCPFSTFPYSVKGMTSRECLKKYSCGNCIALSLFIKQFLRKNYGLKSYLIPASIPKTYQRPEYLHLCHVAVAIPKNKESIYIADPAFYFTNPISFDMGQYPKISTLVEEGHAQMISQNFSYTKGKLTHPFIPNIWQRIARRTKFLDCQLGPYDKWRYYLREILNPDEAITTFFINSRNEPWITILDDSYQRQMLVKRLPLDNILIKKYNDILYKGSIHNIPETIQLPEKFLGKMHTGKIKKYKLKRKKSRKKSRKKN